MSILPYLRLAKTTGVSYYVGTGDVRFSTVHVEDLAELYVAALERAESGSIYNASAEPEVRLRDFAEAIRRAVGLDGQSQSLPQVEESSQIWSPARTYLADKHIVSTKARVSLDWKPTRPSILEELRNGSYESGILEL